MSCLIFHFSGSMHVNQSLEFSPSNDNKCTKHRYTILILYIRCINLIISYINQQMHTIRHKSYIIRRKLLHVSALRCHPQGVTNAKEYNHTRKSSYTMRVLLDQIAALVLYKTCICVFVIVNCVCLLRICDFDITHSVHCTTNIDVLVLIPLCTYNFVAGSIPDGVIGIFH
jgi:hypothetical protein